MTERGAGAANDVDFGMCGGVAAVDDAVPAFGNDIPVEHDEGAEWTAIAAAAALAGEVDGAGEKLIIRIHGCRFSVCLASRPETGGCHVMCVCDAIIRPPLRCRLARRLA